MPLERYGNAPEQIQRRGFILEASDAVERGISCGFRENIDVDIEWRSRTETNCLYANVMSIRMCFIYWFMYTYTYITDP